MQLLRTIKSATVCRVVSGRKFHVIRRRETYRLFINQMICVARMRSRWGAISSCHSKLSLCLHYTNNLAIKTLSMTTLLCNANILQQCKVARNSVHSSDCKSSTRMWASATATPHCVWLPPAKRATAASFDDGPQPFTIRHYSHYHCNHCHHHQQQHDGPIRRRRTQQSLYLTSNPRRHLSCICRARQSSFCGSTVLLCGSSCNQSCVKKNLLTNQRHCELKQLKMVWVSAFDGKEEVI